MAYYPTTPARRTKITCTLGPACGSVQKLVELINAGMNVARFNFSHGTHASHTEMLKKVKEAEKITGKKIALMLDTKGPEIRTGILKNETNVVLQQGQELTIRLPPYIDFEKFEGDNKEISIDYANLAKVTRKGAPIKIDDGLIVTTVIETNPDEGTVKVIVNNSAELGQRKGVNLPKTVVDLPAVTERDKADLIFGVDMGFDLIAASFMRNANAVHEIRNILGEKGKTMKIICKIENEEGLHNFDEILDAADGIMVARGDLGVEIPIQKVCMAQKMMIRKCNLVGKPVITATQMLESMVENPRPTRAEANDVANAVFDGTDCVMLSGETAKGKYPVEACATMARICSAAELAIDYQAVFNTIVYFTKRPLSQSEAITSSAVKAAMDLDVAAIIVLTESGRSAQLVAKYMPRMPVIVVTPFETTLCNLLYSRGVFPVVCTPTTQDSLDSFIKLGMDYGKSCGWLKPGQRIVLVSGLKLFVQGSTSMMQILDVPE